MTNNEKYIRFCGLKYKGVDFEYEWDAAGAKVVSRCLDRDPDCENLNCLYAGGKHDPFFDTPHAVHSDFLVHWTGRDIDDKYDPYWEQNNDTTLNKDIVEPYVDRLINILKYGLWMTSSKNDQPLFFKNRPVKRPLFYRTCFSELKLSEARVHAKRFGRLGIGVKRLFVLSKRGAPLIYYRKEFDNWFFKSFPVNQHGEIEIPSDAWWAYFLKPMNEAQNDKGYIRYKNFDEAEWRIIYSPEIEKKFGRIPGINRFEDVVDDDFLNYLRNSHLPVPEDKWPKYLLPLDKWLAFIIFPNLAVKAAAESRKEITDIIQKKIKSVLPLKREKWPTSSAEYERYSMPFFIDLDACRNF